jgi:hypothetical protein
VSSVRPSWTRQPGVDDEAPTEAARAVEGAPPAPERRARLAGWLAVALAALYPLVEALREIVENRPVPLYGDNALLDLAARRASHLDQLVGPYSREGFHHPGPVSFYIMAPFVRLLGSGQGGYLAAVLVTGACAVAITAVLWRWSGPAMALYAAAALGAFELCVRVFTLREPWNPYMVVAPMLLLGVLAAGAMAGRRGAWGWAAVAGSYALQTHLATAPTVVAVLVAAALPPIARGVWDVARRGRRRPPFPSRPALVGLGVAVLAWVPALVELAADHPNNVTLLLDFYRQAHPLPTWHEARRAAANALAIVPFGNHTYVTSILRPRWQLDVTLVGSAAAAAASLALAARRRLGLPVGLVVSGVLVAGVGTYGLKQASGGITAYFATWMAAAPLLVLLALGAAVLSPRVRPVTHERAHHRPPERRSWTTATPVLAGLAVVALVATGATVRSDIRMTPASRAVLAPQVVVGQMAGQVLARAPRGRVALDIVSAGAWPEAAGVALALYRHGVSTEVSPAAWTLYFGNQDRPGRPAVRQYSFYSTAAAQADHVPAASVLASGFDVVMVAGPPPPGVKPDPLP